MYVYIILIQLIIIISLVYQKKNTYKHTKPNKCISPYKKSIENELHKSFNVIHWLKNKSHNYLI